MKIEDPHHCVTHLGKYRIDSQLGQGAMGTVYKAYDEAIDRVVAIKTIRTDLIDTDQFDEMKARFICGAQATARCQHPNILMVFEYAEENDQPFMVMEYVEGVELKDYMFDPAPPNIHDIVSIFQQLLEGLAHSHSQKVIHRDIKPANIILSKQLRVKIADFGIAKIDDREITRAGYIIGTPSYMAPEQVFTGKCDSRSDLYAVGLMLFELLSKFHFRSEKTQQRINPRVEDSLTSKELARYIPKEFVRVIKTALRKSPEDRFQNADGFSEELLKAFQYYDENHGSLAAATILPRWQPVRITDAKDEESLTSWDIKILDQVVKLLTRYVGPIARLVVRNAAHKNRNLSDLVDSVSSHIPDDAAKLEFLKQAKGILTESFSVVNKKPSLDGSKTVVSPGGVEIFEEEIEEITQELRVYLGPIAKRLVLKCITLADNNKDFFQRLAEFIPAENDKKQFLRHFLY